MNLWVSHNKWLFLSVMNEKVWLNWVIMFSFVALTNHFDIMLHLPPTCSPPFSVILRWRWTTWAFCNFHLHSCQEVLTQQVLKCDFIFPIRGVQRSDVRLLFTSVHNKTTRSLDCHGKRLLTVRLVCWFALHSSIYRLFRL